MSTDSQHGADAGAQLVDVLAVDPVATGVWRSRCVDPRGGRRPDGRKSAASTCNSCGPPTAVFRAISTRRPCTRGKVLADAARSSPSTAKRSRSATSHSTPPPDVDARIATIRPSRAGGVRSARVRYRGTAFGVHRPNVVGVTRPVDLSSVWNGHVDGRRARVARGFGHATVTARVWLRCYPSVLPESSRLSRLSGSWFRHRPGTQHLSRSGRRRTRDRRSHWTRPRAR